MKMTLMAALAALGSVLVAGVEKPVITPESGTTFDSALTVTISCPTAGATIHYTTDGSEPTQDSSLYKRFRVTERTTVKARAFDAGGAGRGSLKRVAPFDAQHGNTRTGDRCAPEASGRRYGVTRCEVGVTSF